MKQRIGIELFASPPGQDYIDVKHCVPLRKDLFHKRCRVVKTDILRYCTINNCGLTGKIEQCTLKRKLFFSLFN